MMREIIAYRTTDGAIFENREKAVAHQNDIIGEILDTLIADIGGNITRVDRHKTLIATMESPEFLRNVTALYNALQD